ncbi:MAG TPA: nucleoside hydrolase [Egibacteraceae bacterium]|nr:nucleoside hydrolase [Egibacteraceae bacterium]
MRVHLDTDFAGDTDDACALAMLLGWPGAEVVGITTTADPGGERAGYVDSFLRLAGRDDIPVAAGASASLTTGMPMGALPDHDVYWGEELVVPRPSSEDAALQLIARSADQGATIIAIGPYTNLARLEATRPGQLGGTAVVLMGGWVRPPTEGLPAWGPEMDWNVQCDTQAALTVFYASGDLTLVTLPATLNAHLRAAHLEQLVAFGPIGQLLARQALAHGTEHDKGELGRAHAGLPDDLLNFQYDPVACAVALSWPGVVVKAVTLGPVLEEDVLRFQPDDGGKPVDVVIDVDGPGFAETWLAAVERVGHGQ